MYRFSLALRYLRRRKVAYISVLAIAVGVMAMIVVNSVMDGFQRRIKDSIFKVDGSLKVELKRGKPANTKGYFDTIAKKLEPFGPAGSGEIQGMSKRIVQPAMLIATDHPWPTSPGAEQTNLYISLIGIDPVMERQVLRFDELLDAVQDSRPPGVSIIDPDDHFRWNLRLPSDPETRAEPFVYVSPEGMVSSQPGIILGSKLAKWMGVEIGSTVHVLTAKVPEGSFDSGSIETISKRFRVTGCFESGRYEYDRGIAFCDVRYLKDELLHWAGDCSEVRLKIANPNDASILKEKILASNDGSWDDVRVFTWEDQMRTLAQALEFEKLAMWLVTAFVVLVAGVSIGGLLYMVVLEKTRDIGILQSMGATAGGIVTTFLLYGGLLGILGTSLGVWLGIVVVQNLNGIIHWLEGVLDRTLFPPDIYEFGSLPSHLDTHVIATYALFTFAWCLLVSAIPAFVAARLNPLRCLSYE